MDSKLPLTVVVLTFNEKERLQRCLGSLRFASQVVVMDSYSTDGTLEEASKLWRSWNEPDEALCLVQQKWLGFEKTRNLSRSFAAFDWILWVDADEWLSDDLVTELKDFFENLKKDPSAFNCWVYRMPRLTYFLGRPIYHGGWYPDRKRRLGHRKFAEWRRGPHGADVHEDLFALSGATFEGQVGEFKGHLFHETFRNVSEQEQTNDRYSSLLAEGLAATYLKEEKKAPTWIYIYIKVGIKFLENYILKLGFLDAYPGWLIAKGSALSLYMRFAKLRKILETHRR